MKIKSKSLTVLAFVLASVLQVNSQGYIVLNGVRLTVYPGFASLVQVAKNPTNGLYTGFFLENQTTTTFLFDPVADQGVRTFLVSSNNPISLQPILANNYPELTFPNIYTFANGTQFYLGFYTGSTFPQNGIYNDPLFGWARLVNNNGVIQLLDGALEYGGDGIYAGTQNIIQPVPEPGTVSLLLLGGLAFGLHRRRK